MVVMLTASLVSSCKVKVVEEEVEEEVEEVVVEGVVMVEHQVEIEGDDPCQHLSSLQVQTDISILNFKQLKR